MASLFFQPPGTPHVTHLPTSAPLQVCVILVVLSLYFFMCNCEEGGFERMWGMTLSVLANGGGDDEQVRGWALRKRAALTHIHTPG